MKDIPAFPSNISNGFNSLAAGLHQGMTLRDWFAGKTLNGMLQNKDFLITRHGESIAEKLSRSSYEMADAMMKARESGEI